MNIVYESRYVQKSLVIQGSIRVTCCFAIRAIKFKIVRVNSRVEALKDISDLAGESLGWFVGTGADSMHKVKGNIGHLCPIELSVMMEEFYILTFCYSTN